jgi:hypothetical protein
MYSIINNNFSYGTLRADNGLLDNFNNEIYGK